MFRCSITRLARSFLYVQSFRELRFVSAWCFGELVRHGSQLIIATRPEAANRQVANQLRGSVDDKEVVYLERAELHAKGIVGDGFSLSGSMNLTFNGVDRLTEMLDFQTERGAVEQLRLSFQREYGGRI